MDVPGADQDLLYAQRQVFPVRLTALRHSVHLVDAQWRTTRHLPQRHDGNSRLLCLGQPGQQDAHTVAVWLCGIGAYCVRNWKCTQRKDFVVVSHP